MNTQSNSNKILVRRIYEELWNQANPAVAQEIFTCPEGVIKFMTEFLAAFPDLHHSVEEIICKGNQAASRFNARGTHAGRWREFPASRKAIYYTGVTWVQISDGKIVEHHTWWDRSGLIEQIKS